MADGNVDPAKVEKNSHGSGLFEGLTSLFPYPMRWVGSAVFLLACVASIIYLVSSVGEYNGAGRVLEVKTIAGELVEIDRSELAVHDDDTVAYLQFETVEILLRIAAVGLVLAALSGERNGLVVVIGLVLVGALIVPTKDMMRIYLAATDSSKRIEDFYGDSGGGPELRGRDPQLASAIVDILFQSGAISSTKAEDRSVLYWMVEEEIIQERVATLLERSRARGALEILAKIQAGQVAQTSYRYGDDERHLSTLRFLRNASLINYVYDDLDTMEVTALGLRVLHRARSDGFSAEDTSIHLNSLFQDCLPRGFGLPPHFVMSGPGGAEQDNPSPFTEREYSEQALRLGRQPIYVRLRVDGQPRSLTISVAGINGVLEEEILDETTLPEPVIELYDVGNECEIIGVLKSNGKEDDLVALIPQISRVFDPGDYVIRLRDERNTRGRINLAIGDPDAVNQSFVEPARAFLRSNRADCSSFENNIPSIELSTNENVTLDGSSAVFRVFEVAAQGQYQIKLEGTDDVVDPYLEAQFVPAGGDCSENRWEQNDDMQLDTFTLDSQLNIDAIAGGKIYIAAFALSQLSEGAAVLSVISNTASESSVAD
jgi:hypothetical protein